MLIAGVGGEAARLFVFQDLVQSLQQRQSLLLEQTHDLHSRSVHTALDQAIFLVPKVPTQYCLEKQGEVIQNNTARNRGNQNKYFSTNPL